MSCCCQLFRHLPNWEGRAGWLCHCCCCCCCCGNALLLLLLLRQRQPHIRIALGACSACGSQHTCTPGKCETEVCLLGLSLNFVTSVCDNRQVRLLYPETRADVAAFPEDVAEHVKDAMETYWKQGGDPNPHALFQVESACLVCCLLKHHLGFFGLM